MDRELTNADSSEDSRRGEKDNAGDAESAPTGSGKRRKEEVRK